MNDEFNKKIEEFAKLLIRESLLVNSTETKVSQQLNLKDLDKWIFKAEVIKELEEEKLTSNKTHGVLNCSKGGVKKNE